MVMRMYSLEKCSIIWILPNGNANLNFDCKKSLTFCHLAENFVIIIHFQLNYIIRFLIVNIIFYNLHLRHMRIEVSSRGRACSF